MRTRRWVAMLGAVLAMGAVMSPSAGLFGLGGTSWKEEVLLHDGQKIVVKRSQSYGGRHEIGQPKPIKEHALMFTPPGSNTEITWTSEYGDELGRTNFNLLALHILNGTPYVIASPNLCLSYNKWGRPNPPYVVFKYSENGWRRIGFAELPGEFKTANIDFRMTWHIRDQRVKPDVDGLLSAETIKRRNAENEQPEYRSILREPLSNVWKSCPKMISYGKQGGWIGLDWFADQPSREACLNLCGRKKVSEEACPCREIFKGE